MDDFWDAYYHVARNDYQNNSWLIQKLLVFMVKITKNRSWLSAILKIQTAPVIGNFFEKKKENTKR